MDQNGTKGTKMDKTRFEKLVDEVKADMAKPDYDHEAPFRELGKLARRTKKPKKIIRVFVKSDHNVNEYIRCTNVGITLQGVKRNIYAVHGLVQKTILKRYGKFKDYPIDDIACEVYQMDFGIDVEAIKR